MSVRWASSVEWWSWAWHQKISGQVDNSSDQPIGLCVAMVLSTLITQQLEKISLACPWLKRIGLWGFLFFLVKGLLWLVVPWALIHFGIAE